MRCRFGHLEVSGRDGEAAVVSDAHLDLRAAVVAQQPRARGAVGSGQHLDAPPRKADARAVEALDDRLLRGPATGEALVVARAVGLLGGRVDLVEEALATTPYGKSDPLHRHRVDADALHATILPPSPSGARPVRPLRRFAPPPHCVGRTSFLLFDGD